MSVFVFCEANPPNWIFSFSLSLFAATLCLFAVLLPSCPSTLVPTPLQASAQHHASPVAISPWQLHLSSLVTPHRECITLRCLSLPSHTLMCGGFQHRCDLHA